MRLIAALPRTADGLSLSLSSLFGLRGPTSRCQPPGCACCGHTHAHRSSPCSTPANRLLDVRIECFPPRARRPGWSKKSASKKVTTTRWKKGSAKRGQRGDAHGVSKKQRTNCALHRPNWQTRGKGKKPCDELDSCKIEDPGYVPRPRLAAKRMRHESDRSGARSPVPTRARLRALLRCSHHRPDPCAQRRSSAATTWS